MNRSLVSALPIWGLLAHHHVHGVPLEIGISIEADDHLLVQDTLT